MTAMQLLHLTNLRWLPVLLLQNLCLNSIWLINSCNRSVTGDQGGCNIPWIADANSCVGMVTLSPKMVAPVCHVGDPLQLTCNASVEFIQWSILRVNEQGTLDRVTNDVILNSGNSNKMMQTTVNSIVFTFTRVSTQEDIPLISTLTVDSVGIDLNGTVVRCTDVANPTTSASTTIQIIDSNQSELAYPL